jgi:hypothetical protein
MYFAISSSSFSRQGLRGQCDKADVAALPSYSLVEPVRAEQILVQPRLGHAQGLQRPHLLAQERDWDADVVVGIEHDNRIGNAVQI